MDSFRPFTEFSLPKPEVSRPRIDEKYGLMQLALRMVTLLADFAGIAIFIWIGSSKGYVNQFAIAATCWALIPDFLETVPLFDSSRRLKRLNVVLLLVMEAIVLALFTGSWFWYLHGQKRERFGEDEVEHDDTEYARGCLYVTFALFPLHVGNLVILWVDLCRRQR